MAEDRYNVGTLEKGLRVLDFLDRSGRPMRIHEVAEASGIERGTVFRLLHTLQKHGYVERLPDKSYRGTSRRKPARIGYSGHLGGTPFRRDVTEGIRKAAKEHRVELLLFDNAEDDPKANLANADRLIEAGVDLVLEFQLIESISHVLADRFSGARIPVIAVETPMPGAVFFGANNYKAGRMAGEELGRFAREKWDGRYDRILQLGLPRLGPGPEARLAGAVDGIREILGAVDDSRVVRLECRPDFQSSRDAAAAALRKFRGETRFLIAAFNDRSALGALQAARSAGCEDQVAVVGQNGTEEGREELRNPDSRLIASIAYFPERYGEKIVPLALSLLDRQDVPLAVYTEHAVLDRSTLDRHYPASRRP